MCKGAFNNYVDQISPDFDTLPFSNGQTLTFYILLEQIWSALLANFLTLRVWEGTEAIQDDKYLKWQKFGRNDNNMEGMTIIQKE